MSSTSNKDASCGTSLQLGLGKNFGRYSPLDPIPTDRTYPQENSASANKAQQQIKALEADNMKLRRELAEMSSLYMQLIKESKHENYDERRVNLLKSQVIQLERQVLLLSEALGSRCAVLLEIENALAAIADICRGHCSAEGKIGEVSVSRSDLHRVVETAESARIKLYKNIENTAMQRLEKPLLMMSEFTKRNQQDPVSILDVCSGELEHINLKHVAKLESKLSKVYSQLTGLHQSLACIASFEQKGVSKVNSEVPHAVFDRMNGQVSRLCHQLKDVNSDLLELSLLVPAAPWPAVQRAFHTDVNADAVLKRLGLNLSRSKMTRTRQVLDCLVKAFNYTVHMARAEAEAAKGELVFHKLLYDLQLQYADDLFRSLQEGYAEFEESTNDILCKPLKDILRVYEHLKATASEEALRQFLAVFKQQAEQIAKAVQMLAPTENKGRGEAISSFGKQFYDSLSNLHTRCQKQRDNLVNNLDLVKEQQEEYMADLTAMFGVEKAEAETAEKEVVAKLTPTSQKPGEWKTAKVEVSPGLQSEVLRESDVHDAIQSSPCDQAKASKQRSTGKSPLVKSSSLDQRPPWNMDFTRAPTPSDSEIECQEHRTPSPRTKRSSSLDNRPAWNSDFASSSVLHSSDASNSAHTPPQSAADANNKGKTLQSPVSKTKRRSSQGNRPPWNTDMACSSTPAGSNSPSDQSNNRPTTLPKMEDFSAEYEPYARVTTKPPPALADPSTRATRMKREQSVGSVRKGVPQSKLVLKPREAIPESQKLSAKKPET